MDGDLLSQMGSGFAPVASGRTPQLRFGFEGLPGMSRHPILGMMAGTYMQGVMGQHGMTPMGLGHDQNAWDIIKHRQFNFAQRQAMALAAEQDRQAMMNTFRGVAAVSGVRFGAEQRRAAGALTDAVTAAAPLFATTNPDMLDMMGGYKGSAMVMANRFMEAGRYQVDPVTGRMGLSGDTGGRFANMVYDQLYNQGEMGRMRGLTAGQAGSMYQELQSRGMIGRDNRSLDVRTMAAIDGMGEKDRLAVFGKAGIATGTSPTKLSAEDIDKLTLDPAVADKLRSFDATKIKRSIQSYAGAIAAMRDIFGDLGRPNAPVAELFRALETMTGGQLANMDPQKAAMMARQTSNLAKSTGVTLDTAMMMQGHFQNRAQALGIENVFGIQASQNALAFGGAYRALGMGSHAAWGAMGADQVQQLAGNLTVGAASSNMANRLAAVARLSQTVGGFQEGSDIANMVNAIKGGHTQFEMGGKMRSLAMGESDFYKLMSGARGTNGQALGISENDVREFLSQRDENRQWATQNNLGNTVFRMQGRDQVDPFVATRLHETMVNRLTEAGMGRDQAITMMKGISGKAWSRIRGMGTADFSDDRRRDGRISEILEEEMRGAGGADFLDEMTDSQRSTFFKLSSQRFYGRANQAIRSSGLRAFGNLQNVVRIYDPAVIAESQRNQDQQAFEGQTQDALAPLNQGGLGHRLMGALQNAKAGTGVADVIGEAIGGIKGSQVQQSLVQPLQEIQQKVENLKSLQTKLAAMPDGPEKANLQRQVADQLREVKAQSESTAKLLATHGVLGEEAITAADTKEALATHAGVAATITDLAGVRGGFGMDVTKDQLDKAKSDWRTRNKTAAEAAAVIQARRISRAKEFTPEEEEHYKKRAAELAKEGQHVTAEDLKAQAVKDRIENSKFISRRTLEEAMGNRDELSDVEASAFETVQRQLTSLRPTDAQVKEKMQVWGETSEERTRDAMLTDALARRFGFTDKDEQDVRNAYPEKKDMLRQEALGRWIAARDQAQYDVRDDEIDGYTKGHPEVGGNRDAARVAILEERRQQRAQRYDKFDRSEDGAMTRDQLQKHRDIMNSTAERLVSNKDIVRRFGTQAVDWHDRLRAIEQRKRVLAYQYTEGDVDKLQLMGAGLSKDASKEDVLRVRNELMEMHKDQQEILTAMDKTHGKSDRQYRLGDEAAARAALGYDPKKELTEDETKKLKDKREEMGNQIEAGRLMGLTDDEVERLAKADPATLSPIEQDKQRQLKARSFDVGVARRIRGPDEELLDRANAAEDLIVKQAKAKGVKPQDILDMAAGKAAVAGLTVLSPEQSARRTKAIRDHIKAVADERAAASDVARAERALKTATPATRAAIEAKLAEAKSRLVTAQDNKAAARTSIEKDATGRGVSIDDYFGGKGFATEKQIEEFKKDASRLEKVQGEVKDLAKRVGVDKAGDILEAKRSVIDPQLKLGEVMKGRLNESGMAIAEDMGQAFFGKDFKLDRDSKDTQEFAGKLGATTEGRAWGQYLTVTQKWLTDIADAGGGAKASDLARDWKAAMAKGTGSERDAALKELQTKYKIDMSSAVGRQKWEKLTESLDVRQRAGLLENTDFSKLSMQDLAKSYDRIRRGGEKAPTTKDSGAGGSPRDIRVSGTLELIGNNRVDVNTRSGGNPGNAVAP